MLPCPKCGNTETNGTFCTNCLKELHPLVKKIKPAKLTCCVESRRIKLSGTWKPIDEAVTVALAPALVFTGEVSAVEIETPELEWKPGIQKWTEAHAVVTGKNEDAKEEYEEQYDIPVQYLMTVSPEYKKRATQYFEGVLQVRNENRDVQEAIRSYVKQHRVHITKTAALANGTDYYMTDHRAVGHLAQKLHKQFGGEVKVNAQHFSHDPQKSKNLYRTNALVHIPEFRKGDVILRNDAYLLVTGMGRTVTALDLKERRKESFTYRPGESHVLPTAMTKVTNTNPVEVSHPRTFRQTTPVNDANVALDQHVNVAMDGDILILIPQ